MPGPIFKLVYFDKKNVSNLGQYNCGTILLLEHYFSNIVWM